MFLLENETSVDVLYMTKSWVNSTQMYAYIELNYKYERGLIVLDIFYCTSNYNKVKSQVLTS